MQSSTSGEVGDGGVTQEMGIDPPLNAVPSYGVLNRPVYAVFRQRLVVSTRSPTLSDEYSITPQAWTAGFTFHVSAEPSIHRRADGDHSLTGLASDAEEEITSLLRNEIWDAKVGDLSLPHPRVGHQADK